MSALSNESEGLIDLLLLYDSSFSSDSFSSDSLGDLTTSDSGSDRETIFNALESAYSDFKIQDSLGKGAFSEVLSFVYGKEREWRAFKLSAVSLAMASPKVYKLNAVRLGGEPLGLLKYGPHVLRAESGVFYDHSKKRYCVLSAEEVQAMFESKNPRENFYTLIGTVSEYTNGTCSLRDLMDKNSELVTGTENIDDIMRQILLGLKDIHSRGLMHRDIKLSNILMTTNGIVKIADFGTVRKVPPKKHRRNLSVCGTITTMSPEICSGKPYDEKTDSYSAAATLLQLLLKTVDVFNVKDIPIPIQDLELCQSQSSRFSPIEAGPYPGDRGDAEGVKTGDADAGKNKSLDRNRYKGRIVMIHAEKKKTLGSVAREKEVDLRFCEMIEALSDHDVTKRLTPEQALRKFYPSEEGKGVGVG